MSAYLYLHGLHSSVINSPKVNWLKSFDYTKVMAPEINYSQEKSSIFSRLSQIVETEKIQYIVGSSMGGFLGYHLGSKHNLPTLLFNPSLIKTSVGKPDLDNTGVHNATRGHHSFVLGLNDEVVDPTKLLQFISNTEIHTIRKITFEPMAHRVPLEIFRSQMLAFWADNGDFHPE